MRIGLDGFNPAEGLRPIKGDMKVVNDVTEKDTFTKSDKSVSGFFHNLGEKIKHLFSGGEEAPKESGGWGPKPDGTGYQWYPESSPPAPLSSEGHWILDTACGAADWFWQKDAKPAPKPESPNSANSTSTRGSYTFDSSC
ncbi:MAG: hypothetical protein HYU64_00420 [Armatimonadetes bacterium]|nr:hypothetical protein [Armatimonadota bacterium]